MLSNIQIISLIIIIWLMRINNTKMLTYKGMENEIHASRITFEENKISPNRCINFSKMKKKKKRMQTDINDMKFVLYDLSALEIR